MEQEVVFTSNSNIGKAVVELTSQLRHSPDSYNAVIFMAAITYDFQELSKTIKEKFPKSEVIGTSTAGEITSKGFSENTIVMTTMSCSRTKVKGVLVKDGSKYPMLYKEDIEKALRDCGISCNNSRSHEDAFALCFINAVFNAEESVLSTFYSIIKNDKFMLAGGTAGYTGSVPKSFVSYNGEVTQDGAVMLFVKTSCHFDIRQEDIFVQTGKKLFVTESKPMERLICKIDGRPAKSVYAEMLGVSESQAEKMTFENPFGKYLNGSIHITALAGFTSSKDIALYARVVPNSSLDLMHIGNPVEKAEETCKSIKSAIPHPKFAILMTCVTRTIHFKEKNISGIIIDKYKQTFPTFCGFSCYGEQIGRMHCNQTLVTLVIGE